MHEKEMKIMALERFL